MSSEAAPFVVECIGLPGSGKSTLANGLIECLSDEGANAASLLGWARTRAAQGSILGQIVETVAPRRLRSLMLWWLFYVESLLRGVVRVSASPALRRPVLHQVRRPIRGRVRSHIAFWFVQLVGRREVVSRGAQVSDVMVVDDGFLHRACHLFASHADGPDRAGVQHYAETIPLPDVLVHVGAPPQECVERIRRRGIWKHSNDLTDAELHEYLDRAKTVVDLVVSEVRRRGVQVVEVDGTGDGRSDTKEVARLVLERLDSDRSGARLGSVSGVGKVLRVPRRSRITASLSARFEPGDVGAGALIEVLGAFGLEPVGSQRNLRLSRRSQNVVVDTHLGKKVVKIYRPQWTPDTVECGHSVLRRLEEVGFPAPVLVRTPEGRDQVQTRQGVAAVFGFLPGTNLSLNYMLRPDRLRITAEAGATLARMHRVLDGFEPSGAHHLGFVSLSGPRRRTAEWYAETLGSLADRSSDLADPEALGVARMLIERSDGLLDSIADLDTRMGTSSFRRVVIHGDYGIHNLLFAPDRSAVPVDFELSRLDWRVNDLISALGKHRYRNGSYDFESMQTFLSAYAARFPLDREEAAEFPGAWRLYKLHAAVQYWYSYFMTDGPVRKLHSAIDALDQADRIAADDLGIARLARSARTR